MDKALSCDVLCLFGFSHEEIKPFAEKNRVVFSAEPPFDVYYDKEHCDLESFEKICQEEVFQKFFYLVNPSLSEEEQKAANEWICRCQLVEWQVQLSSCEYEDFRIKVFKNEVASCRRLADRSSFVTMKGFLQGVPAIICGGGPSLEEARITGKEGMVFAGGAALSFLSHKGVKVHIAAGVDPSPCHLRAEIADKVPFFYQGRFDDDLVKKMEGPLFQIPSNPGYLLESFLEQQEPFDGGWTVTTFCTALALYFGCNPIVFVGVDLSYGKEGQVYAEGMVEQQKSKGFSWKDSIQTQKDWVLASKWIEEKVAEHKNVAFYTTSAEGLPIQGVEKKKWEDVALLLAREINVDLYKEKILMRFTPSVGEEERLLELKQSIDRSLICIDKMLFLWKEHYPNDPSHKGAFVLEMVELEAELAYLLIVAPIWKVWQYPLRRRPQRPGTEAISALLFYKKILEEYRRSFA